MTIWIGLESQAWRSHEGGSLLERSECSGTTMKIIHSHLGEYGAKEIDYTIAQVS